ncbi:hypothetical protein KEJ50_06060 [Candidatus Bathyarchaeota archaeon]|nr:hypothetical protein [Candidatus Bathyarchaeota archaeon]
MISELKKTFLKLLEEDLEFRYAIAGLIGLREVLNRLDKVEEEIKKLWEEVKELRIGQNKLWEEVKALREGQNKLWENQNKLWEEVKALREGQNKLWEEVKALREGQNKLWEEVKALREEQTKIWGEIKGLKAEVTSFGRAVGRTLEDYTSAFIEVFLEEKGYSREEIKVGKGIFIYDGEIVEVDVFNEKPLIVGEVTTYLRDEKEAEKEVEKLLKHIEAAQKKFKRNVEFKFLSVGNAPEKVIEFLKETAKMHGVKLIYGKSLIEEG